MEALKDYSDSSNSDDERRSSKKARTKAYRLDMQCTGTEKRGSKHKYSPVTNVKSRHTSTRFRENQTKSSKSRSRSRSPVRKSHHGAQQPILHKRVQPSRYTPSVTNKCLNKNLEEGMKELSKEIPPSLVNTAALKFESIKEKRKRLWSSKKEVKSLSRNQWELATFTDGDDATQAKFRRLMGISSTSNPAHQDELKKDEHTTTLKRLEQQYEASRYLTHVVRGVGLGFASNTEHSDDVDL